MFFSEYLACTDDGLSQKSSSLLNWVPAMKKSAFIGVRSAMPLILGSLLVCVGGVSAASAQSTTSSSGAGRPVSVGAQGGTIDTYGSDDMFSTVAGGNMLTITNSNASKGSSLEVSGSSDRVGGLNVSGSHTKVVFSGPGATVYGPVVITNNTNSLHFNGDGSQVSGPVANYGALVFGQSGTATVSGTISGTGKVVQRGPGVTTIMGTNTYSGGTVIEEGGTVVVSSNKNLGAPDAPVVLNGGTLRTIGNVLPDGATAAVNQAVNTQLPPVIPGSADSLNEQELQSLSNPLVPNPAETPMPPPPVQAASLAPIAPRAPVVPTWTLSSGELIGKQLVGWGNRAGWHVVWNAGQDWVVASSTHFTGDFKKAASQVLEFMAAQGAPIHGVFYTGNHTLVVTNSGQ